MYISRANVNHNISPNVFYNKFGDFYKVHNTIWSLFDNDPNKKRDFIFKQDNSMSLPVFYIVSKEKPIHDNSVFQIETKEYNPQITSNQTLCFSLCANPAITRQDKEYIDENGKRQRGKHHKYDVVVDARLRLKSQGIIDDRTNNDIVQEECIAWLNKKSTTYGFELNVDKTCVDSHNYAIAYKSKNEKITFGVAYISGVLTVTEPEKFIDTLYYGIGKQRSFGCGLLMVKPIR